MHMHENEWEWEWTIYFPHIALNSAHVKCDVWTGYNWQEIRILVTVTCCLTFFIRSGDEDMFQIRVRFSLHYPELKKKKKLTITNPNSKSRGRAESHNKNWNCFNKKKPTVFRQHLLKPHTLFFPKIIPVNETRLPIEKHKFFRLKHFPYKRRILTVHFYFI